MNDCILLDVKKSCPLGILHKVQPELDFFEKIIGLTLEELAMSIQNNLKQIIVISMYVGTINNFSHKKINHK